MCGIFGVFNYQGDPKQLRERALALSKRLRHRGPDWTGIEVIGNNAIAHERLAILDPVSGDQPFVNEQGTVMLAANGEIYNHLELRKHLKKERTFKSTSDCEVLLYLYEDLGPSFVSLLDGIFALVAYDAVTNACFVARDPIGVVSLYHGQAGDSVWFASEMKALVDDCDVVEQAPPGHVYTNGTWQRYSFPRWIHPQLEPLDLTRLRETLVQAVRKRLMADAPYGVLLSGGLDSSLVAAMATKLHRASHPNVPLHSFAIGLPGSPDLQAAAHVAHLLGTHHHSLQFTVQQGLDALSDVIYHLETFDVTTIRASTPMFLLSRKIKALGVKMVLSGEGADEIFGGYLYFHQAPNAQAFHAENVKLIQQLHTSDCLRANKSTMAWGLEARVPFLDLAVLDVSMSLDAHHKLCTQETMEKFVLRKAFEGWLPPEILWRQKEQFSDGVGYQWIDQLKLQAEQRVSDADFSQRALRFPDQTPPTKEAYWYRTLFEAHFPQPAAHLSVRRWVPQRDWGCPEDPSGRAQEVHVSTLTRAN